MPALEKIVKYDDLKGPDILSLRFRAWRQAKGWSRTEVDASLGEKGICYKIENPAKGLTQLMTWRVITELYVDARFLMTGDMKNVPAAMKKRLSIIMDRTHSVRDADVVKLFRDNGIDPLLEKV